MNPILRRTAFAGAAAGLLAATPLAAQENISFGRSMDGEITASDPVLADGTHYDLWEFQGTEGQRVIVTLRSTDFDAFLVVGRGVEELGCEECETDDDGGGGLDSRVVMTLPATGTYRIRANTIVEGETGGYTLILEDAGTALPLEPSGEIQAGRPVSGELAEGDALAGDDSYFELWTYRGRPGERITITMRSEDFDTFLGWGRLTGGRWEELDSDDDGDGGTDSRLDVTLGDDMVYQIRANTLFPGESGAYTLTVERR